MYPTANLDASIFRATRLGGIKTQAHDYDTQWIQGFFNHFASTAHVIGGKLQLKYPPTTFVKAKS